MCRSITELRGLHPAATPEEVAGAARQYVRKVSGITCPSSVGAEPFGHAVAEVGDDAIARRFAAKAPAAQDSAAVAPDLPQRPGDRAADPSQMTMPALKEWSAVVHALLDGSQRVLLRKGGIGEKRFEVAAREFLLFPTVAHSHVGRVRPEYRDLLDPAAADCADDGVRVRAAAKVVAALPVNRPEGLAAIEDLHIWTAESVRADRLDFRPKHKLAVLVVSVIPLIESALVTRAPEYAGCTSWVQLPLRPAMGTPAHGDAELARVAARVSASVV